MNTIRNASENYVPTTTLNIAELEKVSVDKLITLFQTLSNNQ